jgi:hypothetical protein
MIISFTWRVGGVLTDVTSAVLSDPTAAFGVRRLDTGAVVVAAGTAMTHPALGTYQYSFADPAYGLIYNYWVEIVYLGNTYNIEHTVDGPSAPSPAPTPAAGNCSGRYATAQEYAMFWCATGMLVGTHDGVDGAAILNDVHIDFAASGVEANVGMVVQNITDGSEGVITAVSGSTVTATLSGGTDNHWDTGDVYRIVLLDASEAAVIELYLDIAASNLHAALAASGACDCTFASWAAGFLKKLNIVEAAAFHHCKCADPNLTDDMRSAYLEWATNQIELIRNGKLELCSGATGAEFPAVDFAEQGLTEFNAARIIANDRGGT